MKIKSTFVVERRVGFDMTPMIDCTFQLIIFFMLTLRYAQPEGDFNIKMPLADVTASRPDDTALPPIRVRLRAAGDGRLAGIQMNERPLGSFQDLRDLVRSMAGGGGPGAGSQCPEIELDCDYKLDYEYVIRAITAVSGYTDDKGNVTRLVEKIKFSPPRKAG